MPRRARRTHGDANGQVPAPGEPLPVLRLHRPHSAQQQSWPPPHGGRHSMLCVCVSRYLAFPPSNDSTGEVIWGYAFTDNKSPITVAITSVGLRRACMAASGVRAVTGEWGSGTA